MDFAGLGFRCGLEIHQQVKGTKLFCRCSTEAPRQLDDDHPAFSFVRRLRPTQSELGEVDAAALTEARRNRLFEYRGFHEWSCLVEADEEPPHPASENAQDVALTTALLLQSTPVDELQWMRKIVIDGSNTSGFQRTGLVARGGRVDDVGIQTICLEEDSARRIRDEKDRVVFGLDRLGIPLVEVATEPSIRDGVHARQIAAKLGSILRSTGQVKRGLGTIRQDLNISIRGAPRVEVKGVQELAAIAPVIEWEVRRQQRLIQVAEELKKRSITPQAVVWSPQPLSDLFEKSSAGFIRKALDQNGIVLGLRLPGFHGLIGAPKKEDPRLGRELSSYAKRDGGVQGILHGDELPGMGVSEAEVVQVRRRLECGAHDSFVLVVEKPSVAERALSVVHQRALRAFEGVLPEVRAAEPDRTTSYLRPMPGAARMYPETDVPPNPVTPERLRRLRETLPPPTETVIAGLRSRHGLSLDEATQIASDGLVAEFETLAQAGGPTLSSRVLLSYLPDLERKYPGTAERHMVWAREALEAVRAGRFAKEGVPVVLESLARGEATSVDAAIASKGLGGLPAQDVEKRARELIEERIQFVRARGVQSVQPLMGVLMKEFRGKVDGARLNEILEKEVRRVVESAAQR